jgi:type I restriction enzyme S subunit
MTQYRAVKGDILVSKINARKKAIGIVASDHDVGHTIHFRAVAPRTDKINREFLWMALRSGFCQAQFAIETGGMGKGEISEERLLAIRVPHPPIETQEEIVSEWHDARRHVDQVRSTTKTAEDATREWLSTELGIELKTSKITKRAFAMSWQEIERWSLDYIRRKPILAKEPDKYPLVRLGQVIKDLSNGWSPKCLDRPAQKDEWGVLKLGAVSFGTFIENENKALSPGMLPRPKIAVKSGDVLFVRGNVLRLTGACSYVDKISKNLMMPDLVFRAELNDSSEIEPKFLAEVMALPFLRNQIESIATGSSPTMKKVSKPGLLNLEFPLPPLKVQRTLLKHITSERERIAKERHAAEERAAKTKVEVEEMILGHRPVPTS